MRPEIRFERHRQAMKGILRIPDLVRRQLNAWARNGYPNEACGVLVGERNDHNVSIARAVLTRNANTERPRDRYELQAEDLLAADRSAEVDGLEIVGIWHTHPDHPAHPSEADRAQAWRGWSYLILSVEAGRVVDRRSWRLIDNAFEEEIIEP
jgi:proteasome lid subunit RPN8/RPN11